MLQNAKWIWCKDGGGEACIFRYTFACEKRPKTAMLSVAATGRCFVWLNGSAVLKAGGRQATDTAAMYDAVDVAEFVKKGVNVLVIRALGGAEENGIAVECEELRLASSDRFLAYRSDVATTDGDTYCYNATTEHKLGGLHTPEFISDLFAGAQEFGEASATPPRPVPPPAFDTGKKRKYDKTSDGLVMPTVFGAAYPRFSITANSGDRVRVEGSLTDKKLEYVATDGEQTFEFDEPLYGVLTFHFPPHVKFSDAGYTSVTFGGNEIGALQTDCEAANRLFTLSADTFAATCQGLPTDFAGGKTLSALDACVAGRNALYLFAEGAQVVETLFSAALDAIEGTESFIDVSDPLHTLLLLGNVGLAGDALGAVNNADLAQRYLTLAVNYLKDHDADALSEKPIDDGYNADTALTVTALTYAAVALCQKVAADLHDDRYDEQLSELETQCKKTADGILRAGGLTQTVGLYDDRADALAILSGLAPQFMTADAGKVMASAYNASPLFEGYVIEALFEANAAAAFDRMTARNAVLDRRDATYLGSPRAACAGYIGAILRGLAGVKFCDGGRRIVVTPDMTATDGFTFTVPTSDGKIVGKLMRGKGGAAEISIDAQTETEVVLRLRSTKGFATDEPIKVLELKKGKNNFKY